MAQHKTWLSIGTIALILFFGLARAVSLHASWLTNFDTTIQQQVAQLVTNSRTQVSMTISFFGSPAVVIILTLLLAGALWLRHERLLAVWIMLVQIGGDGIAFICKKLIHRPRPNGKLLPDTGFSFPSGHTFSTALLILTLLFIIVPLLEDQEVQLLVTLLAIIWLCLVAWSRFYLRDHYPSDVLASLFLATAWWSAMRIAYLNYLATNFKYLKSPKEGH